jgi:hypothetical protein
MMTLARTAECSEGDETCLYVFFFEFIAYRNDVPSSAGIFILESCIRTRSYETARKEFKVNELNLSNKFAIKCSYACAMQLQERLAEGACGRESRGHSFCSEEVCKQAACVWTPKNIASLPL